MGEADSPPEGTSANDAVAELLHQLRQNGTLAALLESAAQLACGKTAAPVLSSDTLRGANEIAAFLYGDRKFRRRVYSLVNRGGLPVFRIGVNICARRTVLLEWIAAQERGNLGASRAGD